MCTFMANTWAHRTVKSSFSATLSEISHSHQLSFPLPHPAPFMGDKINRIRGQNCLGRIWESTTTPGHHAQARRLASPRPSVPGASPGGRERPRNGALPWSNLPGIATAAKRSFISNGERNRGHRLDTKDRNSALKKKKKRERFSLSQKERKLVTNVLCCKVDNGKCKENIHYVQDITILYSTKCALFQWNKR